MSTQSLKNQVRELEKEVERLSEQYELLNSNKRSEPAITSNHDYFDGLINGIMVKGMDSKQTADAHEAKKRRLENEQGYSRLQAEYSDKIQLENCYRLGGLTAFPVNPSDTDLLGLRFDVYDEGAAQYVTPHYVILKRKVKNGDWFVFKSTLPSFIPVAELASVWLNTDLAKFGHEIRRHLVALQARKDTMQRLAVHLEPPARLQADLDYTKVSVKLSSKLEIILTWNESRVAGVMVVGDGVSAVVRRKLELGLGGCELPGFDTVFFNVLRGCKVM